MASDFDFSKYPDCVWNFIMLRCDAKTVIKAIGTCSTLSGLIENDSFWCEWCRFHGNQLPPLRWRQFCRESYEKIVPEERSDAASPPGDSDLTSAAGPSNDSQQIPQFDYKKIAVYNPYYRNLAYVLKGTDTVESLTQTKKMMIHGSGDGVVIESPAVYCDVDNRVQFCFATSFDWCSKIVEVDLVKEGVEPWILDNIRPKIVVREMANCRQDCGAVYEIEALLLKSDESAQDGPDIPYLRSKFAKEQWEQWKGGRKWSTIELVFEKYPVGMRKLMISSFGKDTQFWAGHYGSKFANMEVIVEFPEDLHLFEASEFPDQPQPLPPI